MPAKQREYLEMVTTYPRPSSDLQWCRDNNVDPRTVRRWRADKRFRKAWEDELSDQYIMPDKIDQVVKNMHTLASTGNSVAAVNAGKLYLEYIKVFRPEIRVVQADESVDSMSDEQLIELAFKRTEDVERLLGTKR